MAGLVPIVSPHPFQLIPVSNPGLVVKAEKTGEDDVTVEPQSADVTFVHLSTFVLVPAFVNPYDSTLVSIQSNIDVGITYLRHQYGVIKRHPFFNGPAFIKDSSFFVRPGLSDPSLISFESNNNPGLFITVVGQQLKIEAKPVPETATFRINPIYPVPQPPVPVVNPFPDSIILDKPDYGHLLNDWVGNPNQKWQLLFRASRDGKTAQQFHTICDGKGATYTIIRVGANLFGGYNPYPWKKDNTSSPAKDSFIFTLVNPSGKPPTKILPKDPNGHNGPYNQDFSMSCFGYTLPNLGSDLAVAGNGTIWTRGFGQQYVDSFGAGVTFLDGGVDGVPYVDVEIFLRL